jgi:hypothetical protein
LQDTQNEKKENKTWFEAIMEYDLSKSSRLYYKGVSFGQFSLILPRTI